MRPEVQSSARSAGWKPARLSERARSGFTLVELLVVIAILGIIMGVSIPTLHRKFNPNSIEQAVKDVMDGCKNARAYAILQGVPVDMVFDGDTGVISLQPAGGAKTAPADADALAPVDLVPSFEEPPARSSSAVSAETLSFSARLSESVAIELMEVNFDDQLQYVEARVRFYPNGTCDECKILLLHQESGARRLITFEVSTGLADVEDPLRLR
jgi:prepilin-type N-terminal cleavage/methylation domain-containing protein